MASISISSWMPPVTTVKMVRDALGSLYKVYFKRHGMQVQANMLDPKILIEARDNPELHPNLLIRVSGYSAYFNDLSPEMQDEVISRSSNRG
jgi:pyruvate-formate lyase